PRRARARRAGEVGRADQRPRAEGRRRSAQPSGALRPRGGAQRQGPPAGGGRQPARDRQARPPMERRRRAQAAGPALRRLGADRRGYRLRAQEAVVDPVLVEHDPEKWIPVFGKDHAPRITSIAFGGMTTMPMNAAYHGPGDLPDVIPVFPLPGALLLP